MCTHAERAQRGWGPLEVRSAFWGHASLGEAGNLEVLPRTTFPVLLPVGSWLQSRGRDPPSLSSFCVSSLSWELDFLVDLMLLSVLAVPGRARALPNVASTSVREDSGGWGVSHTSGTGSSVPLESELKGRWRAREAKQRRKLKRGLSLLPASSTAFLAGITKAGL